VLPRAASAEVPAPLLLWVHGGPMSSWKAWSWRWNPWLAAARGWAVLLPDPALSTGYGQKQHRRGWRDWVGAPYDDVMALTDVACARPDIDAEHTAMMGALLRRLHGEPHSSARRTTRRSCAGVHGDPVEAAGHFREQLPHYRADKITTPMLVIHGNRDYQVPKHVAVVRPDRHGVPGKFLYFPDENHWILKPGHVKVWYETCFAFLDHHVHASRVAVGARSRASVLRSRAECRQ
jgi:dipeptidyl aminopeptidase/acylaminoacyl peptidase